uniref:Uncharacterized protein n=1 Tax=Tanacetum cinerariifolium TaxID=118510 RepID=A0A699XB24_TANCI|nr:hypothetical protein [Tanacetum cinerariifolium]
MLSCWLACVVERLRPVGLASFSASKAGSKPLVAPCSKYTVASSARVPLASCSVSCTRGRVSAGRWKVVLVGAVRR